jgi:Zn-dependent protease with chaperone function
VGVIGVSLVGRTLNSLGNRSWLQTPFRRYGKMFLRVTHAVSRRVNAWVMQRGGIMGFGSRRVMGLGLPLMRILTCAQFSAVLAHEFGHYHGGDTKIGPWIYKTRGGTLASRSSRCLSISSAICPALTN